MEFPGESQWRRGEGTRAEASGGLHRVGVGQGVAHEKLRLSPIPTPAVDQQPVPGASASLDLSFLLCERRRFTLDKMQAFTLQYLATSHMGSTALTMLIVCIKTHSV